MAHFIIKDIDDITLAKIGEYLESRQLPKGNYSDRLKYAANEFVKIVNIMKEHDIYDIDHLKSILNEN